MSEPCPAGGLGRVRTLEQLRRCGTRLEWITGAWDSHEVVVTISHGIGRTRWRPPPSLPGPAGAGVVSGLEWSVGWSDQWAR